MFFLENHNVDSSQRNIIFLVRGDHAKTVQTVAGMLSFWLVINGHQRMQNQMGSKSRVPGLFSPLFVFSLDPNIKRMEVNSRLSSLTCAPNHDWVRFKALALLQTSSMSSMDETSSFADDSRTDQTRT